MATKAQKRARMQEHYNARIQLWKNEGLEALAKAQQARKEEAEKAKEKARLATQRNTLKEAQTKLAGAKKPPTREEAVAALAFFEMPVPA